MLQEFQLEIGAVRIVPSNGGVFEVAVNGDLLFSKANLGRHAEPGEVMELFRKSVASAS
jgi:selenoprotein W-related protein|tara:strand:- start:356 stop:532 length:177 start_codon:yes stop_codon:yes gene_type:complete